MFQLEGDIAILYKFRRMPIQMQKKHAKKAVRKAAQNLVRQTRNNTPFRYGLLEESIGYRPRSYRQTSMAIVGPRSGFATITIAGKKLNPSRYAWPVERGHGGPHPAAAEPFLEPAFDETEQQNMAIMAEVMAAGIEEEARK